MKRKRLIYLVITVLSVALFCGTITSTLDASASYMPEDNVREMNYGRSQVYLDGEGYLLDDYVKEEHKKEEEKHETLLRKKPLVQPTPSTRRYDTSPGRKVQPRKQEKPKKQPKKQKKEKPKKKPEKKPEKKPDKKPEKEEEPEEVSEDPVIRISLKEGETITGTIKKFTVKAVSYDGDDIPAGKITVKMNGTRLLENGANTYIGTVVDGKNTITVKATDNEGRSSEITRTVKGNTTAPPKVIGSLKVIVTAKELGISVVVPRKSVKIYENEQLSDVVKRYFEESSNVSAVDIGTGYFELGHIKKKGIIDEIPEKIIQEFEEKGIDIPSDKDSLGLNDFGPGSGWVFTVNGKWSDEYMSSVDPKNGMNIEISYSPSGM